MEWSPEQQRAIDAVQKWMANPKDPVFRLFGFAGTGKTTLARHLAADAGNVLFGAYTGKAASVLQDKGCDGASTIHKLIYLPAERSRLRVIEAKEKLERAKMMAPPESQNTDPEVLKCLQLVKEEEKRASQPLFGLNPDSPVSDADLLIVDECSMVDERMGRDLLSFGTPVLVLGDPAQLPPIKGGGFFTNGKPDAMLTEIHRQAADNPIIRLATEVREGRYLDAGQYGDSLVIEGRPPRELVMAADQILVGKNETRRRCNHQMRKLLGLGEDPLPVEGDKLVCLRNDHEVGLLNGTLWEVVYSSVDPNKEGLISLGIRSNGGINSCEVDSHTHYFLGTEDQLPYYEIREAQCFDYGYALTTHKSQGSQWDSVFIFDESFVFRSTARQWLYTAITRAAKKVVICRNN